MSDIFRNSIFIMYKLRYYLLVFWMVYLLRLVYYSVKYFKSNYKKESNIGLFKFLFNVKYFNEGLLFMRLEKIKIDSKILSNLLLPTKEGFKEADLIYINTNGIYMITSENHKGVISGNKESDEWQRNKHGIKYSFLNILNRNKSSIDFMKENWPNVDINQIIVFNKKSNLKKLKVNRRIVIKERDFERRILKHRFEKKLTKEEIDKIYLEFKEYSINEKLEKQAFIDKVTDVLVEKVVGEKSKTKEDSKV